MSIRRLLGVAFLFLAISMFIEQMWWVGGICLLIGIGMTAKWRKKKHIW